MEGSTVVGVFADRSAANSAVAALEAAGFTHEHIGFVGHGDPETHESGDGHAEAKGALAGASRGSLTGGAVGGILGALAALIIPGIGPIVAGGMLAGIVAGAVAGGAVGGLAGLLHGMGVPDHEASYYEGEFRGGKTIVTVRADDRRAEAADIMRQLGAYDASTRPADAAVGETGERVVETPVRTETGERVVETPVRGEPGERVVETPVRGEPGERVIETPGEENRPIRPVN